MAYPSRWPRVVTTIITARYDLVESISFRDSKNLLYHILIFVRHSDVAL